jgi:hypothetical protein
MKSNKLISKALSNYDIIDKLKKKGIRTNIIKYEDLDNVKNIEDCLIDDNCIIMYQTTRADYGHWTCLIRTTYNGKPVLELFDPYGMVIDDELNYSDYLDGERKLTKLLYKSGKDISYNHHKFQKMADDVATCGCWVIMRILNKKLDLEQFYNKFKNINDNDIAQMVHKLF